MQSGTLLLFSPREPYFPLPEGRWDNPQSASPVHIPLPSNTLSGGSLRNAPSLRLAGVWGVGSWVHQGRMKVMVPNRPVSGGGDGRESNRGMNSCHKICGTIKSEEKRVKITLEGRKPVIPKCQYDKLQNSVAWFTFNTPCPPNVLTDKKILSKNYTAHSANIDQKSSQFATSI